MNTPKSAAEITAIVSEIIINGNVPTREMIEANLILWEKEIRLNQSIKDWESNKRLITEAFHNEE
jgi:hypothetical protein